MDLSVVPESHRDLVRDALDANAIAIEPVLGGASGALTYKVTTPTAPQLLRMEADHGAFRNPAQYECMRIAADAGIAPPLRYLDAASGVVVMPFIDARPIAELGGPDEIAAATARLLAQLHAVAPFPSNGDFFDNLRRILGFLTTSGRVRAGLLDPHTDAFEQIAAVYPWKPDTFVSAHNDPNPANVLYDGNRLWLIDWETAAHNDPFVDLAIAANTHALEADVSDSLLRAYFDSAVEDEARRRLALMQPVVRLWAGLMLLLLVPDPDVPQHTDLTGLTPEAFMDEMASGRLRMHTPASIHVFAKVMLRAFLDGAGVATRG